MHIPVISCSIDPQNELEGHALCLCDNSASSTADAGREPRSQGILKHRYKERKERIMKKRIALNMLRNAHLVSEPPKRASTRW